jgi:hypothetical protein
MTITLVPTTTETITDQLLDFANHHCNQEWTAATAPARVNLFIERATAYLSSSVGGVQSKRLGDLSITYSTEFPKDITDLLGLPKMRFI